MSKINVFVFATHHLSGNIAAQRFKGLLKYLDPAKFRVFVFTRPPASEAASAAASSDAAIQVVALPGHCVGGESSAAASLFTLAAAFIRSLPFRFGSGKTRSQPWLVHALAQADRLCAGKLAAGERCVVIGTYSPIDALIAAAALAARHHIACLQDFRDGLVFEPLGKPGRLRRLLRTLIEARVVAAASVITSVSRPLVEDFQRRYPHKTTAILPNGYDPADFLKAGGDDDDTRATDILDRHVPTDALLIGHFGRIGASDGSASKSLDFLVDALNASPATLASVHVMFVGELTQTELASLKRARFAVSVLAPVDHAVALQLMQRCDKLLLLTGTRTSCATGKLFEYLAAGPGIVCVSAVRNAATAILAETRAGQAVLSGDGDAASEALRAALSSSAGDAPRDIAAYSRVAQAGMLDRWISEMVPP